LRSFWGGENKVYEEDSPLAGILNTAYRVRIKYHNNCVVPCVSYFIYVVKKSYQVHDIRREVGLKN